MSSNSLSPKNLGMNFAYIKMRGAKQTPKKVLIPNSMTALKKNVAVLFKLEDPVESIFSESGDQITSVTSIEKGETLLFTTAESEFKPISVHPSKHRSKSPALKPPSTRIASFGLSPNIVTIGPLSPLGVDQARLHYKVRDTSALRRPGRGGNSGSWSLSDDDSLLGRKKGDIDNDTMLDIMKSIFGDVPWIEQLLPLFALLSEDNKTLFNQVNNAMKEQKDFVQQALMKLFGKLLNIKLPPTIEAFVDMKQFASQIIENHRFLTFNDLSYNFKIAICGPRRSGKSVFFKILSDQIIREFSNNDVLYKTLVVAFDMKTLSLNLTNVKQFYLDMVDIVCKCLATQKPYLARYIAKEIKPFFLSVLNEDPPTLKRSLLNHDLYKEFFNNLQDIGELLNLFWNDPSSLSQWYTNVSHLPSMIAKAAGFDNTLFLIDNFEYCDVQVSGQGRFNQSEMTCFVSEYFKYMITNNMFIISCEDEEKLYHVLVSLDDLNYDYTPMEFVSISDIDAETALKKNVIISIKDVDINLQVGKEICGGIPAYIYLWNTAVNTTIEYEKLDPKSEEYEEKKYLAISQMQALFNLAFTPNDNEQIENPLEKIIITQVSQAQKKA